MAIAPVTLDYSQFASAAIEAAAKLVAEIPDSQYINTNDTNSLNPLAIARWKAVNIGHLAVTMLHTMKFRNDIAGTLPLTQSAPQPATTFDGKLEQVLSKLLIDKEIPPCTTPGY